MRTGENTKDFEVMKVVYCPAVGSLMNVKDCNETCQHFIKRFEDKTMTFETPKSSPKEKPVSEMVLCKFPTKRIIAKVSELEFKETEK